MSGEIDHQKDAELYDLKDRLLKAEWVLERLNYRHCDIPACNCNGYHRMTEPNELDHLRQDNERLKGEVSLWKEGCERNADLYRDAVRAQDNYRLDLKAHKSCLEVARGALDLFVTTWKLAHPIQRLLVFEESAKDCSEALHQINEVLGGTKPT